MVKRLFEKGQTETEICIFLMDTKIVKFQVFLLIAKSIDCITALKFRIS